MYWFQYGAISDPRFEELSEIIEYDDNSIAMLNQDDGFINLRIGFLSPFKKLYWDLPFEIFLNTLQLARENLYKYKRNDEPEIDLTKNTLITTSTLTYRIIPKETRKHAEIYSQGELLAEIHEVNGNLKFLLHSNSHKPQDFNEIQWDFLFQEFVQIINEAKNALVKSNGK